MQYKNWQNDHRLPSSKLVFLLLMLIVLKPQGNELFDGIEGSQDFEPIQAPATFNNESEHTAELIPKKNQCDIQTAWSG